MVAQESTAQKDEEIIISIVKEMTESMTGAQSTRHWAEDVLWFDIPPFASRGIQPALKCFDRAFGNFQSCKVDIVETDVVVNGDMGLVCTANDARLRSRHPEIRPSWLSHRTRGAPAQLVEGFPPPTPKPRKRPLRGSSRDALVCTRPSAARRDARSS